MADISKINVNDVDYNIKDATAAAMVAAETTRATAAEQANASAAANAQSAANSAVKTVNDIAPDASGNVVVEAGGGIEMIKLWENASPTSTFGPQTIAVDFAGCDLYVVDANIGIKGDIEKCYIALSAIGEGGRLGFGGSKNYLRAYSSTENSIVFDNAYSYETYGGSKTVNNTLMIPVAIYGIKGVKNGLS